MENTKKFECLDISQIPHTQALLLQQSILVNNYPTILNK
jgi:hypothetical protein